MGSTSGFNASPGALSPIARISLGRSISFALTHSVQARLRGGSVASVPGLRRPLACWGSSLPGASGAVRRPGLHDLPQDCEFTNVIRIVIGDHEKLPQHAVTRRMRKVPAQIGFGVFDDPLKRLVVGPISGEGFRPHRTVGHLVPWRPISLGPFGRDM